MTTITFKPGASGPFVVRFEDDAGGAVAFYAAQVRIQSGAACIIVDGVLQDGAWLFDFDTLTLSPRLYPASIYYQSSDGWRLSGAINLQILGGC